MYETISVSVCVPSYSNEEKTEREPQAHISALISLCVLSLVFGGDMVSFVNKYCSNQQLLNQRRVHE